MTPQFTASFQRRRPSSACWTFACFALASLAMPSGISQASPLTGTVLTPFNSSVTPGAVPNGTAAGTLLATLISPFSFSTTGGTTHGVFASAVYREAGGTLDFYYQIANDASSSTAVSRDGQLLTAGGNEEIAAESFTARWGIRRNPEV